ncbi:uncharacterized protein DUF736 [Mesorhizobium loti]|uniref:Uncharacterized protein DUF736 n=1 Tax=Rhizobium loti TaxID=381 RepID=A0A8E3B517_RHILI|nr:uncharacterized protein DUF736 [Mesorhizobium loti]
MAQAIPHCHRVKERNPVQTKAKAGNFHHSCYAAHHRGIRRPAWKQPFPSNASPCVRSDYHSVKLDDPSFPAPIYASLVETYRGQLLAHLVPPHRRVTRQNTKPRRKAGLRHVQVRRSLRPLSDAAAYALARDLRAFFTGDLIAAAVVLAAAARAAGFRFSAAADVNAGALRPSPIDFARADRVAA